MAQARSAPRREGPGYGARSPRLPPSFAQPAQAEADRRRTGFGGKLGLVAVARLGLPDLETRGLADEAHGFRQIETLAERLGDHDPSHIIHLDLACMGDQLDLGALFILECRVFGLVMAPYQRIIAGDRQEAETARIFERRNHIERAGRADGLQHPTELRGQRDTALVVHPMIMRAGEVLQHGPRPSCAASHVLRRNPCPETERADRAFSDPPTVPRRSSAARPISWALFQPLPVFSPRLSRAPAEPV